MLCVFLIFFVCWHSKALDPTAQSDPEHLGTAQEKPRLSLLQEWVAEISDLVMDGAELCDYAHMGIGLRATQDLSAGHQILLIPMKLVFSIPTHCPYESLFAEHNIAGRSTVAIEILLEKQNETSLWSKYLSALPTTETLDTPMMWPNKALEELRGSWVADRVREDKRGLLEEFDHVFNDNLFKLEPSVFNEESFTIDDWIWAWSIIWSRVYNLETSPGHWSSFLPPIADFINHNTTGQIDYKIQVINETKYFTVMTTSPISKGDQIFRRYLPNVSPNDMARLFGFFDTSSDQDQAFLNLELPENAYTHVKETWLRNYGLHGIPYPYNEIMKATRQGFPTEVIQWLRVYFYHPDNNQAKSPRLLPNPTRIIDNKNEQDAFQVTAQTGSIKDDLLQALKDVVRDHLSLYKTTIEEDEALLAAGIEDPRLKLIVQIRLSEKQSLQGAVSSLNQQKLVVGENQQTLFRQK